MNEDEKRTYLTLGAVRLFDIQVLLDGQEIYNGKSEDLPAKIKNLKYSIIEITDKITCFVYSDLNK